MSNCNIDYIKTCNNDNIGTNQPIYICNDFPLFFSIFININEYANYANKVRCIFDHGMKDLCLSFILVQILVLYD